MIIKLSKDFSFDAAHNLKDYHGKCEKLHGHTYRLRVTLQGEPRSNGMILDFGELQKIVQSNVLNLLDHSYLNDLIEQTTAENIIRWIWEKLEIPLKGENYRLYELVLWETDTSFVTYSRNEE